MTYKCATVCRKAAALEEQNELEQARIIYEKVVELEPGNKVGFSIFL